MASFRPIKYRWLLFERERRKLCRGLPLSLVSDFYIANFRYCTRIWKIDIVQDWSEKFNFIFDSKGEGKIDPIINNFANIESFRKDWESLWQVVVPSQVKSLKRHLETWLHYRLSDFFAIHFELSFQPLWLMLFTLRFHATFHSIYTVFTWMIYRSICNASNHQATLFYDFIRFLRYPIEYLVNLKNIVFTGEQQVVLVSKSSIYRYLTSINEGREKKEKQK